MAAGPRFFISAGERSGDMHAANLLEAIRRIEPSASFVGLGRERLIAAGMAPVEDMTRHSVMWLDAIARIPRLFALLSRCKAVFREQRPDGVIVVDYVGFNMFLAKAAFEAGLPVFYYIAPQLWAHSGYRAVKLRKWVRRVLVIYPFEVEFYRQRLIPVSHVGHPLFDEYARNPPRPQVVEELRRRLGDRLVGVMPGSRVTEVRRHSGLVERVAGIVRGRCPEVRFAIPGGTVNGADPRFLGGAVEVVDATVHELALASKACIVKSGTSTLEVGAVFCPMAVFYKVSPFAGFIASGLRTSRFICLVNELAGRELVPERLMVRSDSRWLADRVIEMLDDATASRISRELEAVMKPFAAPGASERAAGIILDCL